jgi:hypothetical protein
MFSPVDCTGRETPGHRARLAKPRSLARSGPRHAPVRLVATSVNNRGAPPSVNTTGRDSETQAERDEATGPVSTGVQGPSAKVEPRGLDRFQRALPDQSLGRFQRVSRDLRAERDKSTGPVPTGVQGAFSEGGAAWSGPVPTGCSRPILGPVPTGIQGSPSGARQINWAGSNGCPGSLQRRWSRVVWTGSNGLFQTNPWAGFNGYPRISERSETNPLGRVQPVSREPRQIHWAGSNRYPGSLRRGREPRGLDRFQRAVPDQSLGRFQRVSKDLQAERDKSTGPGPTGIQGASGEGGATWSGPVSTGCSRPIPGPVPTGVQGSPSGARQNQEWVGGSKEEASARPADRQGRGGALVLALSKMGKWRTSLSVGNSRSRTSHNTFSYRLRL